MQFERADVNTQTSHARKATAALIEGGRCRESRIARIEGRAGDRDSVRLGRPAVVGQRGVENRGEGRRYGAVAGGRDVGRADRDTTQGLGRGLAAVADEVVAVEVDRALVFADLITNAGRIATDQAAGDGEGAVLLTMPPPSMLAELPVRVLLVMVTVPKFRMPPPRTLAELPERVLVVTVAVPPVLLTIPPPSLPAILSERVLLVMVAAAKL